MKAKHQQVVAAAVRTPRAVVVTVVAAVAAASLARTVAAVGQAVVVDPAAADAQVAGAPAVTNSMDHALAPVDPAVSLETVRMAADAATAE
jgi:hypothetical protein